MLQHRSQVPYWWCKRSVFDFQVAGLLLILLVERMEVVRIEKMKMYAVMNRSLRYTVRHLFTVSVEK